MINHEAIQLANATKHVCDVLWENLQEELSFGKAIKLTECEPRYGRPVWDTLYHTFKKIRPTRGRGLGSFVKMTMPVNAADIVEKVGENAGCIKSVITEAKAYLNRPAEDEDIEAMPAKYDDSVIDDADDLADNFQPKVIDAPEQEAEAPQEENSAMDNAERRVDGVSYEEVARAVVKVLESAWDSEGSDEEKVMLANTIVECFPLDILEAAVNHIDDGCVLSLFPARALYDELKRRGYEGVLKKISIEVLG